MSLLLEIQQETKVFIAANIRPLVSCTEELKDRLFNL
jgi:hypothetical protein